MTRKVDKEKDYLAVYKDNDGKFINFRWFMHWEFKDNKEAEQEVLKHNLINKEQVELITDETVRAICAYAQNKISEIENICIHFTDREAQDDRRD